MPQFTFNISSLLRLATASLIWLFIAIAHTKKSIFSLNEMTLRQFPPQNATLPFSARLGKLLKFNWFLQFFVAPLTQITSQTRVNQSFRNILIQSRLKKVIVRDDFELKTFPLEDKHVYISSIPMRFASFRLFVSSLKRKSAKIVTTSRPQVNIV